MFGRILLAATLIVAPGATAFAGAKTSPAHPEDRAAAAAPAAQEANMFRASGFIGETVHNAKGEEIGEVDDLILRTGDKILYAVISVGGFLGIGDKLVAVPFEQLEFGTSEVDGLIVYDTTKEKLKAQPKFHYALAKEEDSRARFMQSAERQLDHWHTRIETNMSGATENAKDMKKDATERIEAAWEKAKAEWEALKSASSDAWDDAKRKFDEAMANLERTWDDATS